MKRLVLAMFLLLSARSVFACSCVGYPTVEQNLANADAVFAGVVTSIDDIVDVKRVTFRVMQWWKGEDLSESFDVVTGMGGGDCGYPVEKGQSFLVFARRAPDGVLWMSICSRTAALVCAIDDVKKLGEPIRRYQRIDRATLIAREQPYTSYWRNCIVDAQLIGERGLSMNTHCSYKVDATIGRDGVVQNLRIEPPARAYCPAVETIAERVAAWRFKPATIDGKPVETRLTRVSMRDPVTETEYAKFLEEQKERQMKLKKDQENH